MSVFKNEKELYQCIGGLFTWARDEKAIADDLKTAGFVVRLSYSKPEAVITIDLRDKVEWHEGDGGLDADVEFIMKGDVGHRFWMGKVNLPIALLKRDIKSKGSLKKALKILPKLKPLYGQYPKILEENGKAELATA